MRKELTKEAVEALVKTETGLSVSLIDANPCFYNCVSLAPFGQIGWALVFKDSQGDMKAVITPFVLDLWDKSKKAA